jgi:hypothetical protein
MEVDEEELEVAPQLELKPDVCLEMVGGRRWELNVED